MGLKKVAIFYNDAKTYSKSLKEAFAKKFGGEEIAIDLTDSMDWKNEILRLVDEEKVQAAVLFPDTTTTFRAIAIAKANNKLPKEQRLPLLGGDTLYGDDILRKGGAAFEGLVLAIPRYAKTAAYTEVDWRMAMSYDATQVIIQSLSREATRQTLREEIKSGHLSADETSGEKLYFNKERNSNRVCCLVKIVEGNVQVIEGCSQK